jgi:hypothetical protein
MGENDETGVTEGISQHPASQEGANVTGSGALSLWSGPGIFQRSVFQNARAEEGMRPTPAANGSS